MDMARAQSNAEAAAVLEARIAEQGAEGDGPEPGAELTAEEKEELNAAMTEAVKAGDEEVVRHCLRFGADPNAADGGGQTALWNAAWKNQVGCMEALAEAEGDLDKATCNGDGYTPLIWAAQFRHAAAVGWLLGREVDWRLTDNAEKTALDLAKQEGNVEAAASLEAWIAEHP